MYSAKRKFGNIITPIQDILGYGPFDYNNTAAPPITEGIELTYPEGIGVTAEKSGISGWLIIGGIFAAIAIFGGSSYRRNPPYYSKRHPMKVRGYRARTYYRRKRR
ncbi:hypothetical protein M0R72_17365 [Candidatus Pacearchaeota archaeon]|jgi:hypothetical protein|nr:hypothetical protein [Candidatus Pacearchaeota archaeon]